ncbi:MAG: hypothetical protein OEM38_07485 [Gammaproteobacteria bacterium]|nr:hypothetical protein [Gammaproteobacteria bacterium]
MKYLILMSLVVLTACSGPITKESIRQNPAYATTFSVKQSYQQVFDNLLKQSRTCYLNQPTTKQLTVVGSRDNGTKTANITLEYVYAMAEHDVILMLDMTYEADKQTLVNVYASHKGDKNKADIIGKWLTDPAEKHSCA